MRRLIYLVIAVSFLLSFLPGQSDCEAAPAKTELHWDYLKPFTGNRDIDTASLHILEKISEKQHRSVYRGITLTRPLGSIDFKQPNRDSSAFGVGPIYLIRNEKHFSGKLSGAVDMSGGFILYDKTFPAGGRHFNFMWRVGPQFIYQFDQDSAVSLGYMLMHVSNGGIGGHNPSYNSHGVSLGFTAKF